MEPPAKETTRGNFAFFLLGIFVALCIAGIFTLGSHLFFHWQQGPTPLVTGEENLDQLIQTDVDLFWKLVPNLKNKQVTEVLANNEGTASTYTYSTNELGFRSPPLLPTGSRFRVLAIGDSTTFGQHVADNETWPAQLQRCLDPEAKRVEVINTGIIGASSFQGLTFLQTRGLALKPDLVIATFGFNDWGGANLSDRERARAFQQKGISGLLEIFVHGKTPQRDKNTLVLRATPGEYLDNMITIARICKEHSVNVVFLLWPDFKEYRDPENYVSPFRNLLTEACRITTSPLIDLMPRFRAATEPVFLDVVHATPAGCHIVAQTLADYIREQRWVPGTAAASQRQDGPDCGISR